MSNLIKNITEFALYLVQGYVSEGDVVVDATCGNGYDTLRLAQLSPAKLYAFDIQQEAVDATRKRLREAGFAEKLEDGAIEVICDSHEHLTDHVKTFIQAAVFNLGYLPVQTKAAQHRPVPPCVLYEAAFPGWNQTGSYVSPCTAATLRDARKKSTFWPLQKTWTNASGTVPTSI